MPKPFQEFHLLMIDSSATGKQLHAFMAFAINGWMRQLPNIAEEPETTDVYYSVYTFNSKGFQCLVNNQHADEAKPIHSKQFQATGETSLFDGTLPCFDHFMKHVDWPSHQVFCNMLLTGLDNASQMHKAGEYADLIEYAKKRGWFFNLLGIGFDPQPLADELGFNAHLHLEHTDPSGEEWLVLGQDSLN